MKADEFYVRFWGVRGSLPCPGNDFAEFGGNTPCLEVRCGDHVLVFDAGSGIQPLGCALLQSGCSKLDLFFTHCHYDHICGLPFFGPLYCSDVTATLWSGHHQDGMTTEKMVSTFMAAPFFPVGPEVFLSKPDYIDFKPGDDLTPKPGVVVRTTELNHPNGCVGYRIEFAGKTICYISDTEHEAGKTDKRVFDLIKDADIVIYDAAYTEEEYEKYRGFGHSTWQEGVRLCDLAGAGRYVIFHHCPRHQDAFLAELEQEVVRARPGSLIAREGLVLRP